MVLCFLVLTLFVSFMLWCLSDNFKIAVLNRVMLRRLKSRLKKGFFIIKVAEIGFEKFQDEADKKSLTDALLTEMNRINEDYKFFICPIDEHIKTCKIYKFIYEDKFNDCIQTAHELEKQCNELLSRYREKF